MYGTHGHLQQRAGSFFNAAALTGLGRDAASH